MRSKEANIPQTKSVYQLFSKDFSKVQNLFTYNPGMFNVEKRLEYLKTNWSGERDALVEALLKDNKQLGANSKTMENITQLKRKDTVAVVTGQQVGLCTGPLLTIYKTLTAIFLCQVLRGKYGVQAVPIFWGATEDHDFQEINHTYYLDGQRQVRKLRLSHSPTGTPAAGSVAIENECLRVINELQYFTPQGKYKQPYLELLFSTMEASANLGEWFGRQMLSLFSDYGLVYFNPMLPELRQLAVPFWERALQCQNQIQQALDGAESELSRLGLAPAVQKSRQHTHLFMFVDGSREPLYSIESGYQAGKKRFSHLELQSLIAKEPEMMSADVILRPVLQEHLLPTATYVAGPGEVNYWAQLGEVFQSFGLEMPLIYPRIGLTLIEPSIEKLIHKFQIGDLNQIWCGLKNEHQRLLLEHDNLGIRSKFKSIRGWVTQELANSTAEFIARYHDLNDIYHKNLGRILTEITYLENKVWQRHSREHGDLKHYLEIIVKSVYPKSHLQETILNIYPYLFNFGPQLLPELLRLHNDLGDFNHKFILMGDGE